MKGHRKARTVLLLGGSGFVGSVVLDALVARGIPVVATYAHDAQPPRRGVRWVRFRLGRRRSDPLPSSRFETAIWAVWDDGLGAPLIRTLFGLWRRGARPRRLVLISSAAAKNRATPYGRRKALEERIAMAEGEHLGIDVVVLRLHNLIGVANKRSVLTDVLAQIRMSSTSRPVVLVGRVDTVRDYLDARDAGTAVALAVLRAPPGVPFDVASGRGVRVGRLLRRLADHLRRTLGVEVRWARRRSPPPRGVLRCVGRPGPFARAVGWRPSVSLDSSLADLVRTCASSS